MVDRDRLKREIKINCLRWKESSELKRWVREGRLRGAVVEGKAKGLESDQQRERREENC